MLHELDRPIQREVLTLTVNGEEHEVLVPVHETLLEVLRERLGLTGTKHGCELGECGTCTVLLASRSRRATSDVPIGVGLRLSRSRMRNDRSTAGTTSFSIMNDGGYGTGWRSFQIVQHGERV